MYGSTGTEQVYPLTTRLFLRPTRKTGSPLTINDIEILQLVANYYIENHVKSVQKPTTAAVTWGLPTNSPQHAHTHTHTQATPSVLPFPTFSYLSIPIPAHLCRPIRTLSYLLLPVGWPLK